MGEEGLYIAKKVPVLTTTQRDLLIAVEGMLIFNSTTDQLEEYDGAVWQAVGQVILDTHAALFGLHTKVVRKTADQTVNDSSTLVNDTHLLFAIAANEVWVFTIYIRHIGATTADIKFAITVPSGANMGLIFVGMDYSPALGEAVTVTSGGAISAQGLATEKFIVLHGRVANSTTAGNVQLQWAQYAAIAVDTKVLTDSCIVATKVA